MTKTLNAVVVVSRWYGGIHLGPDRFKHINNAARQVLDANGFLGNKTSISTPTNVVKKAEDPRRRHKH